MVAKAAEVVAMVVALVTVAKAVEVVGDSSEVGVMVAGAVEVGVGVAEAEVKVVEAVVGGSLGVVLVVAEAAEMEGDSLEVLVVMASAVPHHTRGNNVHWHWIE